MTGKIHGAPEVPDAVPSLAEQFRAGLSQPPPVRAEAQEAHPVRTTTAPPPLPARAEEASVLHTPRIHLAMGPSAGARPAAPLPPPAPAPAVSAGRSGTGRLVAEATCWTLLVLALTGSLLGNALLSAGWRADVAAKEKEALSISTKRTDLRAVRLAKSRELDALRPGIVIATDQMLATSMELRDQRRLENEIKTKIVVMERQLMDANLMPRAPMPKEWPNEALDELIDSNPLTIP